MYPHGDPASVHLLAPPPNGVLSSLASMAEAHCCPQSCVPQETHIPFTHIPLAKRAWLPRAQDVERGLSVVSCSVALL